MEIIEQEHGFQAAISEYVSNRALNDPNFARLDPGNQLREFVADETAPISTKNWLEAFITQDDEMNAIKDSVRELARPGVNDPVLITGPSGTGKELLARALHGDKRDPFIALNCAGFPETLVESELFGHVKGAYTDAKCDNEGVFRAAKGGTIFLDEIGEMSLPIQAKLLRAIQENEVRPVGSTQTFSIGCRFVAATNRDLWAEVENKQFRLDLYARLMTFELRTTPLMSRPNDIPLIVESLGRTISSVDEIPIDYHPLIEKFNVRALQTYVRRMAVFGKAL